MTTSQIDRKNLPCTCRGYDPADPCMHGDTSEGCPRHDPDACTSDDEEACENPGHDH